MDQSSLYESLAPSIVFSLNRHIFWLHFPILVLCHVPMLSVPVAGYGFRVGGFVRYVVQAARIAALPAASVILKIGEDLLAIGCLVCLQGLGLRASTL